MLVSPKDIILRWIFYCSTNWFILLQPVHNSPFPRIWYSDCHYIVMPTVLYACDRVLMVPYPDYYVVADIMLRYKPFNFGGIEKGLQWSQSCRNPGSVVALLQGNLDKIMIFKEIFGEKPRNFNASRDFIRPYSWHFFFNSPIYFKEFILLIQTFALWAFPYELS